MFNEVSSLREFGEFRLDTRKRTLWHKGEPVPMPLKELDLLCLLVEHPGELVTKDEILDKIWQDSFVEESNLSRHIYLLRKTLKQLGQNGDLIQNIPRRGYRFAGEVRKIPKTEIVVEKHTQTRTLIEVEDVQREPQVKTARTRYFNLPLAATVTLSLILTTGAAFIGYRYWQPAVSAPPIKSLAVLPFKAIGSTETHHGLGLTDVLVTRLSSINEINVRPTSAILAFENQTVESITAGRQLNVDGILEGTMYREGDRVRITARLIKVSDNSTLWAGQFEKAARDELRLQDELALQIAETLTQSLTVNEKRALTRRFTETPDAYQLYLKGRYEWNKRSWQSMIEAQRLFRNAIEKDPDFALAHVGLADTLATSAGTEASAAAEKALSLDPNLAEAHASLGFQQTFHKWEWDEAEKSFNRSIELNPGYAPAHHWYATLLAIKGRNSEAKTEMRRALDIDPQSFNLLADMGQLHYFAREYDAATEYCLKALEINPDFLFAREYLSDIYLQTGAYDKAFDEDIAAIKINESFLASSTEGKKRHEKKIDELKRAFSKGGIAEYMKAKFNLIGAGSYQNYYKAMTYSFTGEKTAALDNLEKAVEQKSFLSVFAKADPIFDPLRNEPRYQKLLREMKLKH